MQAHIALGWLGLATLGMLAGCGSGGTTPPTVDPSFDRRAMIAHLADAVIVPNYVAFAAQADGLVAATNSYCQSLADGGDVADSQVAAQTAWRTAMTTWQRADVMLLGPAAMNAKALRDRVYAWPLGSTCGVDQSVMARWSAPASFTVASQPNNRRSLTAVEYLLFAPSLDHTCPNQSAPSGWDALSDADRRAARCGLAKAVADDVAAQAEVLLAAWTGAGNYRDELVEAGTASSSIVSQQEAVNLISDSMFYVDKMIKDMKLGEAAGIVQNQCATVQEPCLAEVEHRHADAATAALTANLVAFRELFTGTVGDQTGPGFDDFLAAVGATEVSERMLANLDASLAAVADLDGSMLTALASDYGAVVAAHGEVRALTEDLKSQFLAVLGLDIPDDAAADND